MKALELRYDCLQALEADCQRNLGKGRAFVVGAEGLRERQPCRLRVHHPHGGEPLELAAEAVWISAPPSPPGIGLQIVDFGDATRQSLEAFAAPRRGERDDATPSSRDAARSRASAAPETDSTGRPVRNIHDRIRDLSIAERDALARAGTLPERVALERRYGSSVWEGLLRNPMITSGEVARIAKSGSLPKPLLNVIVNNSAWLADANIQRSLLKNPRLTGSSLDRLLRSLPAAELARLATSTACRAQVRAAAKRLVPR